MKKIIVPLVILAVISLSALFLRQNRNSSPAAQSQNQVVQQVSPQQFALLAKNSDSFVLDVHTPEQTHIPGTDAFIPYDEISKYISELPTDKNTPILVYCRSGNMSSIAAKELASLGYTKIYDLIGGTNAYKESNVTVSITPDTIPLGTVVYGDVAHASFTLTNYSPLPMKITRVSTSCGCTKAEVEKKELGPYESTNVNVSFDPAVHKDFSDLGDLTRTIYIETDNPNFSEIQSTITATVVKPK